MKKLLFACLALSATTCFAQHRLLVSGCAYGEVAVYAADGTKEWSIAEKNEADDAWLLPNNDVVMAYKYGVRIIRPDWESGSGAETLKDRPTPNGGETHSCQPLPGGGFLIGESWNGHSAIVELDAELKETKRIELKGLGGKHSSFRQIRKTPQNTYLVTQQKKGGQAMEVNSAGEIIRRFPDGRFVAERLENGNTLIAGGDSHRIIEVDAEGQVVWALEQNDLDGVSIGFAAGVQRLPNGNTIFCNWGGHGGTAGASIIEVSPNKKIVWSTSPGKPNRIANVKVL
ncbi:MULTISPECIES: hypothetical protein [unclassified Lentimonas]|uniref:beta-propeller domain-containing protein n=1 Tax=unclassified Lentimonas TaxID=2630993 RepID=UPI0013260C39|nr:MULTISPECIES: hypothetical protein [unclassified Lentimonas]CAA6677985.1 Unannotated [Lentimonas sp. CC4]CAA6686043.1 Unannotated [Lentimonas sp. CC6]CAA7070177.1 Unannotated [Lentimonas sp. CC11]CAA7077684.1 Unannotated [Lentimonas sp. CC4]CAA7168493.1 Unannotated [Lentimonas sp. CC21]